MYAEPSATRCLRNSTAPSLLVAPVHHSQLLSLLVCASYCNYGQLFPPYEVLLILYFLIPSYPVTFLASFGGIAFDVDLGCDRLG